MSQIPASVQRRIDARVATLQKLHDNLSPLIRQMAGIDMRVVRADITDQEIEKYEAVQRARTEARYASAAIHQLFDFIDDAPVEATALFRGTRHIG